MFKYRSFVFCHFVKGSSYLNKSTASGAKYARSSVIFPHRNGLCQGEVDAVKTGPKLNLIKKIWGKRGWGLGLSYNSNCELSSM